MKEKRAMEKDSHVSVGDFVQSVDVLGISDGGNQRMRKIFLYLREKEDVR